MNKRKLKKQIEYLENKNGRLEYETDMLGQAIVRNLVIDMNPENVENIHNAKIMWIAGNSITIPVATGGSRVVDTYNYSFQNLVVRIGYDRLNNQIFYRISYPL